MTKLLDMNDVAFGDVRRLLGNRLGAAGWSSQPARRVRLSSKSRFKWIADLHAEIAECQCCGWQLTLAGLASECCWLEWHHAPGGARRSDERTAGIMLCRNCHADVATIGFARLLWCKAKRDRENLDWVRLTIIYGSWLPEPIAPANGEYFTPKEWKRQAAAS